MNIFRKTYIALIFVLLLFTAALRISHSDQLTSPTISREELQRLRAQLELSQMEVNLWKEKYDQLNARYRPLRLQQLVRELEDEVSQMRGLPLRHHVKYQLIKPNEAKIFLERKIDEEYPPEKARDYTLALSLLGFVKEDFALKKTLLDLYSEQTAGFYDDVTHTLYVVELFDLEKPLTRLVLAHEMCHALQDQNFSFDSLPLHVEDDDDLQLALMSVIEGDATLFTVEYMQRISPLAMLLQIPSLLTLDNAQFGAAPYAIQQILLFPYMQGSAFVQQVINERGESARNDLFRHYPRSSTQILYPEKFLSHRDDPTTVTLPDLSRSLGAGWRPAFTNVIGEFSIRILLETYLDSSTSLAASSGWKGDRFSLYVNDTGGYALLWRTLWQSDADALKFLDALQQSLIVAHGPPATRKEKPPHVSLQFQNKRTWATLFPAADQATLFISSFEPRGKLLRAISQPSPHP
jgi:hypothetical protein